MSDASPAIGGRPVFYSIIGVIILLRMVNVSNYFLTGCMREMDIKIREKFVRIFHGARSNEHWITPVRQVRF